MAWIDPRAQEYLRKRFTRADAYRFAPPGTPEAKPPGWLDPSATRVRLKEAQEEEARAQAAAEQEALEREIAELREANARVCIMLADVKFELALRALGRKYSPDQPRAPGGSSEGGRWTTGSGTQFAERATPRNYSVNLKDEEAPNGIGHTIRNHVGKTDDELLRTVRERRFNFLSFSAIGKREGSFESVEAANDFVNRTLERNGPTVDLVASGKLDHEFVSTRFGYVTGREAFRPSPNSEPYVRDAFGVGVLIRHDPRSERGYRVITAYPRND